MRASLTVKIFGGFAVPLLVGLAAVAVIERAQRDVADAAEWVDHTDRAIALALAIDGMVERAESAERGFVFTGKEDFFSQYTEARADFGRLLRELRHHVSDNPVQMARLDQANGLFLRWEHEVASPLVATHRMKTPDEVVAVMSERVSVSAATLFCASSPRCSRASFVRATLPAATAGKSSSSCYLTAITPTADVAPKCCARWPSGYASTTRASCSRR